MSEPPPEKRLPASQRVSRGPSGAQLLGRAAEEAAASFLEASGFVVVGRNVRVGRLEIDIVAREGPVIAVVEVRTRSHGAWVRALDSVDWKKQRRVRAAGGVLWRSRFQHDASLERMRFDLLSVTLDPGEPPRCEHVRAAF